VSVLTSPLLSKIAGIEHGFGTREALLTQDSMASLQQIHSDRILVADRSTGCVGEGDGLLTGEPGITVSIRTADCLPILIADARTGAVAAVHAGWRGTAAGIAGLAVDRMRSEFGAKPQDLLAAIGPGIGKCCYQVGIEVARQLGESEAGCVDLADHNRRQLEAAGLPAAHIDVVALCTFCQAGEFFSYRREGERAGRMISFIVRQL
jgi:YfiH family protein